MRPDLISDKELRKLVKTSFPVVSVTWREVTLSDVGFVGGGVDGKLSYTQTGVDYPVRGIRSRNRDVARHRRLSCQPAQCHRVYVPLDIFTIPFSRVLWKVNIPCAKSLQLQLRRPHRQGPKYWKCYTLKSYIQHGSTSGLTKMVEPLFPWVVLWGGGGERKWTKVVLPS